MITQAITDTVIPILKRYGVTHASVFGSFARGEERPDSDLDLRVKLPDSASLFDIARLETELESATLHKVDILDEGAKVHPIILQHISKDEISLF